MLVWKHTGIGFPPMVAVLESPMPYVVIAVSENTNSFGYRGVVAVDPIQAFAFESAWMPGNGHRDILRGEIIEQNDARLFTPLTRQLTRPCERVCREVRKIAFRAERKKK